MEATSHAQVVELWPDIAADLAAVIPDGCFAVRFEDAWFARKYTDGSRLRTVDLARPVNAASLVDLATAAGERARAEGWRQIHREDDIAQDVYRRTARQLVKKVPQFVRVWPADVLYPAATARVLRVDFETGWQRHRMQPLIAPRMIHKLVRDQWGLDAPEESVRIEILHDLADVAEQSLLRETMQLPAPGDFADLLAGHGLEPAGEHRWARTDRYTKGELTTAATLANTTATIALQLDRTKGLRSPHQSP